MVRSCAIVLSSLALLSAGCTEVVFSTPPSRTGTPDDERPEDLEPPVAVCQASADPVAPMQPFDLLGEESYDPDGVPLINWRWSLIAKPTGSAAELPAGLANREGFLADVVGTYAATLLVTNDRGNQSEICAVSVEAEPVHSLWVELIWQYSGDDLDLHVSRNGSYAPADDCFQGACDLDWGVPGVDLDDPQLLRTEVEGTGPELFGLMEPREDVYDVFLFDRPSSSLRSNNIAILTVYIDGAKVWTGTRTVYKESSTVPFVRIAWPGGAITEVEPEE